MPESEEHAKVAGAGCEPWESHGSATACGAAQSSKPDHLKWADMDSVEETTGSATNWNTAAGARLNPNVVMDKQQTWDCHGSTQACNVGQSSHGSATACGAGQSSKPEHLRWADMDSTESLDPAREGRKRWATESMESVEKRLRPSDLLSKDSYQEGPCSSEALVCDLTERFGLSASSGGAGVSQGSTAKPPVVEEPRRPDPAATAPAAHAEQPENANAEAGAAPTSPGGPNDDDEAWFKRRLPKRRDAVAKYKASEEYQKSLEIRRAEGAGPAPRTPDFNNRNLVKRKWEDLHADWKHATRRYIS